MLLLNDAFRALARHPLVVIVMMVAILAISAAVNYPIAFAIREVDPTQLPTWFGLLNIACSLVLSAGLAATYATVFSLLGRAIDIPLWKCDNVGEALVRFFVPWFILILISVTVRNFQASTDSADLYVTLELLLFIWGIFVVPVGACVMHHGTLAWEEFGTILQPIGAQFRMVIPVLLVGVFQTILQDAVYSTMPTGQSESLHRATIIVLSNPLMAVFDLLAFVMMWRICMHHRDAPATHGADYDD